MLFSHRNFSGAKKIRRRLFFHQEIKLFICYHINWHFADMSSWSDLLALITYAIKHFADAFEIKERQRPCEPANKWQKPGQKQTEAAAIAAQLLKSDSKIDTKDKNHVQNVNRNALKVATEPNLKQLYFRRSSNSGNSCNNKKNVARKIHCLAILATVISFRFKLSIQNDTRKKKHIPNENDKGWGQTKNGDRSVKKTNLFPCAVHTHLQNQYIEQ